MINFTRAFDTAWERMLIILFRPFNLGKWFVIGFSAFLAGFLSGGNGSNFSYNQRAPFSHSSQESFKVSLNHGLSAVTALQTGFIVLFISAVVILGLGLTVLIYWLGARGQFLFLDNIVRNRDAVAAPWSHYTRHANRVFVFYLICLGAAFAVLLALGVPAVVLLGLPSITHPQWPAGPVLAAIIGLGSVYAVFTLLIFLFVFLFREWGIPLIFRNDLTLRAAVGETWALIRRWPGPTALFLLLRLALALALIVTSVLACCLTCCVAALPYLGTVVLLPALVYLKCFSLDCLAQFGPAYDVWTVDVPPAPTSVPPR